MFKEQIGEAAVYEQLAEEAAELAHAALKVARILREDNPTPVRLNDAKKRLREEYTDLCVVRDDLDLSMSTESYLLKMERWKKRLEDKERDDQIRLWYRVKDARISEITEHFSLERDEVCRILFG